MREWQLKKIDPFGEKTKVFHPENRTERHYVTPQNFMGLKLPIYMHFCVNSIWTDSIYVARKKSSLFEMEMVCSGNLNFMQNKKKYVVEPGDIFLVHKGSDHAFGTGPAGFACKRGMSISGDALEPILAYLGLLDIDIIRLNNPMVFTGFVKKAIALFEQRPPGFLLKLSSLAFEVLITLANEVKAQSSVKEIQNAINFMHQHILDMVTLDQVADAVCISTSYLCRLFQKNTGKTPMEYYRGLKLEYARQSLATTRRQTKEISQRLGYDDPAYFSRLFKKETGLSPREFRKNHS